jgi:hypothetical protein
MKFIENNVRKIAVEKGYREAARQILDAYLSRKYALSISQLPDSIELSSSIEDLHGLLKEMIENDSFKSDELLYYMNDMFSDDTMQNLIFD